MLANSPEFPKKPMELSAKGIKVWRGADMNMKPFDLTGCRQILIYDCQTPRNLQPGTYIEFRCEDNVSSTYCLNKEPLWTNSIHLILSLPPTSIHDKTTLIISRTAAYPINIDYN